MTMTSVMALVTVANSLEQILGGANYVEVTVQFADGSIMTLTDGEVNEMTFRGQEVDLPVGSGKLVLTCSIPFGEIQ